MRIFIALLASSLLFVSPCLAAPADAKDDLARAKKALADAERMVADVRKSIASHADVLADVGDDLEKARKDQATLLPLLKRAEEDAKSTLTMVKSLAAERKAAREAAAAAVRDAERGVTEARTAYDKQVKQEEALVAANDEYRKARQAVDDAQKTVDDARDRVLKQLEQEPAFQEMRADVDRLEKQVQAARDAKSPDLPAISQRWIEAKGKYESARLARVDADRAFQDASTNLKTVRAALTQLHSKLTGDIGIAEDVVAAKDRLDDAVKRLADAKRTLATADDDLRDTETIVTQRERSLREWQTLPDRLADHVAASQERLKTVGDALTKLTRDLDLANQRVDAAQDAVADAEREIAKK
jgi:chromosome segregation protein